MKTRVFQHPQKDVSSGETSQNPRDGRIWNFVGWITNRACSIDNCCSGVVVYQLRRRGDV